MPTFCTCSFVACGTWVGVISQESSSTEADGRVGTGSVPPAPAQRGVTSILARKVAWASARRIDQSEVLSPCTEKLHPSVLGLRDREGTELALLSILGIKDKLMNVTESTGGQIKEKWF